VGAGADGRAARWVGIRILALSALLVIGLSVVAGRVFWLQVLRRERYAEEAVDQYLREVVLRPRRGVVTDRNGGLLAVSTDARSVFADPSLLDGDGKDPRADRVRRARILASVAKLLKTDVRTLEKRLARGGRFVWLERRIGPDRAVPLQAWLDAERVSAIRLVPETRRYYPKTELAGQLLGVVDDEGLGREGVELAEDDLLRGAPEKVPSLRDAKGRMVLGDAFTPGRAREGARVVLTIDLGLQAAAETALARAVSSSHAASAMAVVLAPGTGEILALATYPTANANAPRSTAELRNRPAVDAFEPGSTLKAMTLAAALEVGALRPGDWIDTSDGRLEIGKHVINDTHRIGAAQPAKILAESSNVGAARIGWRVGAERLHAGLAAFGFGERPGTGLPGEVRGVLNPARGDVELATQAFGQGPITASALQVTNAMAVFANHGALVRPQLVKRVVDPATGETLDEPRPEVIRQVVRPAVAEQLTKWLVGAVEDGTGKRARVDGWRVAGKTGTAQKVDRVGGGRGYSDRRFSSFVGFAPVEQPRFVIGVFVDEPRGDTLGGLVAAPAFREIAAFALRRDAPEPLAAVLAAAAPPPAEAELEEESPGPDPVEETDQAPARAAAGTLVPALDGLSARTAIQRLEAAGLEPEVLGAGLVVGQSPPPGRKVERGSRVRMRLAPAG
jgi:cell division protein FtsI (penicillin-binding protein 3)